MKKVNITLLLTAIALISCRSNVEIETKSLFLNEWKSKLGDSLIWANPTFNDSDWENYKMENFNRNNRFKHYDGYAWFRTKVVIPSSLKENAYNKDSLTLFLGAIDDCDQVFLNGFLIGENTKVVKEYSIADTAFKTVDGLYATERNYVISKNDKRIFWDKENTIAIRVFDIRYGGGLTNAKPEISFLSLDDYIKFDRRKFYKVDSVKFLENEPIIRDVIIKNISFKDEINGEVLITAQNVETKEEVYDKSEKITLQPNTYKPIKVILPVSADPSIITFKFKDKKTKYTVTQIDTIPYVLEK